MEWSPEQNAAFDGERMKTNQSIIEAGERSLAE